MRKLSADTQTVSGSAKAMGLTDQQLTDAKSAISTAQASGALQVSQMGPLITAAINARLDAAGLSATDLAEAKNFSATVTVKPITVSDNTSSTTTSGAISAVSAGFGLLIAAVLF